MQFVRFRFSLALVATTVLAPSVLVSVARAQSAGAPSFPRSENYRLGPGDILRVSVAGFPEFSQDSIPVSPDGVIAIVRLGSIQISGRTRASVQAEIRQRLVSIVRLRNPQVAVSLISPRSGIVGNVTLSGDVPRGGSFPLRENERLSDLLAEVGLSERLEERRAILVRGQARFALDLGGAASRPGSVADVRLRAGDSIAVRSVAAGKITLEGDVERPGVYELHSRPRPELSELPLAPRLSDLLTRAGGLRTLDDGSGGGSNAPAPANGTGSASGNTNPFSTPNASSDSSGQIPPVPAFPARAPVLPGSSNSPHVRSSYSATLQRNGARRSLDVETAMNEVAGAQNIVLRAGDFISIRLVRPITVYLDGAASKTGSFQLAPGAGVLELLTLGGPLTRSAGDLRAAIRRGDQTIPLDLPALLLSSESGANARLQNGDIVQLREPETVGVSVAGQVARPGAIKVRPGATIFEALLAAGGVASGTSVQSARLNVLRRESDGTQRVYTANAAGIVDLTDVRTNLVLHEGDIVNVARGEDQTVFVSGQVANPGSFQVLPGEGLAQLITRAGGPKDDASLTRVRVTRKQKVQIVDALDAVKNGKPLNFALQAGDVVNVPINTDQVVAWGAFAKNGTYTIPERGQLTLLDFVSAAQPVPGVKRLFIVTRDANGVIDPKVPPRTVILSDLQRGKQPNFALSPGDVVAAETPKNKKSVLEYLAPLSLLGTLF